MEINPPNRDDEASLIQSEPISFSQAQHMLDNFIQQFEEGYFPIFEQLARLVEEVGELSRALSHEHGHKIPKPGEDKGSVSGEIGDILVVIAAICNTLNIDMGQTFQEAMAKFNTRDIKRWTPKLEN